MPYPKRLLSEGETLTLDLRPHWWYFAKHIAASIVLLVLLVLVFQIHGTPHKVGFAFWGILALLWAGWLGLRYLNWNFTHFVVTSKRVIYRTGVLGKHGVEIPLDRISNINFNQSMWERVIGAGDLEIESAGRDGQTKFDDVWHPDAVQHELYEQMEGHARTRAGIAADARKRGSEARRLEPRGPERVRTDRSCTRCREPRQRSSERACERECRAR